MERSLGSNSDFHLADGLIVKYAQEELDEYEQVIGAKLRDLNQKQDLLVKVVKKEWSRSRKHHYQLRDNNYFGGILN
jgi:hypothetical protein